MLYPWHQVLFKKITKPYWQQRMGHAFLLTGEEAAGKNAFVKILEQFLLCRSPLEEGPCGHCRACGLFKEDTHPDYHVLGGSEESISIDSVRELQVFLQKTAHQSGHKIITIHHVDALSMAVANALLKNLEEPASQTIFLLIARTTQTVLPTIRSRCIPIHLAVPLKEQSLSWLKSKYPQKSADLLHESLILSHNLPLLAIERLEGEENKSVSTLKEALFWRASPLFNQDDISEKLTTEPKESLYLFYYWVAEYCRYGLTRKAGCLSAVSEKERLDKLLDSLPVESAFMFLDVLTEAIKSLSITGINKGLLWVSLVHQWQQLRKRNSIK